jgi:hypothetical protein
MVLSGSARRVSQMIKLSVRPQCLLTLALFGQILQPARAGCKKAERAGWWGHHPLTPDALQRPIRHQLHTV